MIILFVIYLVLKTKADHYLLPWEKVIAIEQQHHTNYYKFVNMFTDVKHLRESSTS